jgi:Tfp pilus assembly protein FimT
MYPQRRGEEGFTLIELALVAALLATLAGTVTPLFRRSYRALAQETAARRLADFLAYAREKAIMERAKVRVDIESGGRACRLAVEREPGVFERPVDRSGRTLSMPEDVRLRTDLPYLTFFPDGTGTAAVLELSFQEGPESRRIVVEPVWGKVRVEG